jgi:hypothetical protein
VDVQNSELAVPDPVDLLPNTVVNACHHGGKHAFPNSDPRQGVLTLRDMVLPEETCTSMSASGRLHAN